MTPTLVPPTTPVSTDAARGDRLRADRRLAGAEVLRQPQAGNPSFLTAAEYAALLDLLRAAP